MAGGGRREAFARRMITRSPRPAVPTSGERGVRRTHPEPSAGPRETEEAEMESAEPLGLTEPLPLAPCPKGPPDRASRIQIKSQG